MIITVNVNSVTDNIEKKRLINDNDKGIMIKANHFWCAIDRSF